MRKTYIDNIRWITVVLVVFYHVIYLFNGELNAGLLGPLSEVQYQDVYQYIVYPWFMFLLFVVSGMCSRFYLENHTAGEFARSRTRKLLVPSTIGLLVFWWIQGYYNMLIAGAFDTLGANVPKPIFFLIMAVSGTGVLWYIQLLWVFSMLLLLVRKIDSKDKIYELGGKVNNIVLILFMPVIWGSAQILNTPVVVVYRFGVYGVAFFLGYFVFSHDEVMEKLSKIWIPLVIAAAVIGVLFVVLFWGKPYADHEVLDTFFCNLYLWAATLAILSFMKKWGNISNSFTEWMSRKSWGMYLFHYLMISMPAYYIMKYAGGMPPVLIYMIVTITGYVGSILLYEIVSRIPVIRWFACGIKGEKKDVRGESDRTTETA